jgi:prepilin-type N-terminal cleavage/methylation domain-containing protein
MMAAVGPDNFWPAEKWHSSRELSLKPAADLPLERGCDMRLTTSRGLLSDASSTLVPARPRRPAQAGFTLIDMLFVVALIGLLASLAIPGLMRAKDAAQAASALGSVRIVNSAQLSYAISCGLGFYSPDLPTLGVAPPGAAEGFLPPEMSTDFSFVKSGYTFSLAGTSLAGAPATCNGLGAGLAAPGYAIVGDPLDATIGFPRFFGSNSDGVIYEHSATLAADMPEAGAPPIGAPLK